MALSADTSVTVGMSLGALIGSVYASVRSKMTKRTVENTKQDTAVALKACEDRETELKTRISALETEAVIVRKLLPGGDWYGRLQPQDIAALVLDTAKKPGADGATTTT